nr:hypothetical protein Iba_chr15dCG8250 [Ipomoea batatas]
MVFAPPRDVAAAGRDGFANLRWKPTELSLPFTASRARRCKVAERLGGTPLSVTAQGSRSGEAQRSPLLRRQPVSSSPASHSNGEVLGGNGDAMVAKRDLEVVGLFQPGPSTIVSPVASSNRTTVEELEGIDVGLRQRVEDLNATYAVGKIRPMGFGPTFNHYLPTMSFAEPKILKAKYGIRVRSRGRKDLKMKRQGVAFVIQARPL